MFLSVTCLMFYGEEFLLIAEPTSWRITYRRLSETAFSIHFHLPFISGGHVFHYNNEYGPVVSCYQSQT